jgi:hypothetical protein
MAKRFYRGEHEEQRRTGPMSTTNCAAASGAWLVDQYFLGTKDPQVSYFRKLTDDMDGGLRMGQIGAVMEDDFGMDVRVYDFDDHLRWERLAWFLERGMFAVVAGDYDVLPPDLQGADYDGFHATGYHQRYSKNQAVMDPLLDDWTRYDNRLAFRYVAKFDRQVEGGIHAVVMEPQYARLRKGIVKAEVFNHPRKDAKVLRHLVQGKKLVCGGNVKGEEIAGVALWRRVWVPETASFGYVHWTQTWKD